MDCPIDTPTLIRYFADYLRVNFLCVKGTIASYISHVSKFLYEGAYIIHPSVLQSPRLNLQYAGYLRCDQEEAPKRLTIKIPVSFPILGEIRLTILELFIAPFIAAYLAAFCLGYALSLRPGEYLEVHPKVPISHQADGSKAVFWFGDDYYFVTNPEKYPRDQTPDAFSLLLDHTKNDHGGNGGPRSVFVNPDYDPADPDSICCVRVLFEFLSKFPPLPHSPLLSGLGSQVTSKDINRILKITAIRLGIDPSRLVPHSIRFGGPAQMEECDEATQMEQGNWRSVQGMRTYTRRSITHARSIARILHAPATCPLSHTIFMYSTGTDQAARLSDV